jgi:hypothetical protein
MDFGLSFSALFAKEKMTTRACKKTDWKKVPPTNRNGRRRSWPGAPGQPTRKVTDMSEQETTIQQTFLFCKMVATFRLNKINWIIHCEMYRFISFSNYYLIWFNSKGNDLTRPGPRPGEYLWHQCICRTKCS